MRWQGRRGSENIEDRRDHTSQRRGLRLSGPMLGVLVLGLGAYTVYTGDTRTAFSIFTKILQMSSGISSQLEPMSEDEKQLSDKHAQMVSVILADLEETWSQELSSNGTRFSPTTLVLYRGGTDTACGFGEAATGPFYCPLDQKIYMDLSFTDELEKLGASGDFALAYVLAHETGHHIQTLLGKTKELHNKQSNRNTDANNLQVAFELQADCYAGVWTNHAQRQDNLLEPGDIEEGMKAAASVGDDYLQRRAGQRVNPESFTHGSSKERIAAFERGLRSGQMESCDT